MLGLKWILVNDIPENGEEITNVEFKAAIQKKKQVNLVYFTDDELQTFKITNVKLNSYVSYINEHVEIVYQPFKNLILMRHGISCSNVSDETDINIRFIRQPLLTLTGIDQAFRSCEHLSAHVDDIKSYNIHCSMLPRSIQTAYIVASILNIKTVYVTPYLGENLNPSEKVGKFLSGIENSKDSQNFSSVQNSILYSTVLKKIIGKISKGIDVEINYELIYKELEKTTEDSFMEHSQTLCGNKDKILDEISKLNDKSLVIGHGNVMSSWFAERPWETYEKTKNGSNCAFLQCATFYNKNIYSLEPLQTIPLSSKFYEKYQAWPSLTLLKRLTFANERKPTPYEIYDKDFETVVNVAISLQNTLCMFFTCGYTFHCFVVVPCFIKEYLLIVEKYFENNEKLRKVFSFKIDEWLKYLKSNSIEPKKKINQEDLNDVNQFLNLKWDTLNKLVV